MKNRQSKTTCLDEIPDKHIGELETLKPEVLENESRIDLFDKTTKKELEEKLKLESSLVSQESLNVLKEFESI